jgi:hypothetical protein
MILKKNAKIEIFVPETKWLYKRIAEGQWRGRRSDETHSKGLKNGKEEGLAISISYY